ncbi:hypothetical protein PHMEG_00037389, partial [Phytophthora megakarya]
SAKRVPVAVRVVNISRTPAQVLPHTKVATLTDRDRLPLGTNFVRPGSYPYDERESLVYENTRSPAVERRLDAEARELERNAPPMVDCPTYPTPTRVLRRTPETRAVVAGVPEAHSVPRSPEPSGASSRGRRLRTPTVVSGTPPGSVDPGPQVSTSESTDHDAQASSRGEPAPEITASQEPVPESPESAPMDAQVALARSFVMVAMAGETLDAEPAVYYHQGSDFVLLDMLKNQLAYLPDLSDLRPEANIEDAIVGEGNALHPPARGGVCDLDVGDENPISMRVFGLGVGIGHCPRDAEERYGLCIDYRLVNQLIKLMNYPLPLIDELMSNFAATMWFMTLDMASGFWAAR